VKLDVVKTDVKKPSGSVITLMWGRAATSAATALLCSLNGLSITCT
jgi:hypothetical protein